MRPRRAGRVMDGGLPSSSMEPSWPDDAVEVARIGDAWGLQGWFKVMPLASDPQAIFSSRRWFLARPEDRSASARVLTEEPFPEVLRITQAREHGDAVVAQAQGIDDRNAAQALRGARVFIARSSFPTEQAGEYYWVDLIGARVVNRQGQDLGTVAGLIDTGAQSVLRVAPAPAAGDEATGTERLIPFVAAYVDEVDLVRRLISVDWGLDF